VTEQERLATIDHLSLGGGFGDVLQFLGQDVGLFDDEPLERSEAIEIGRKHGCIILEWRSSVVKTRFITTSHAGCQNLLAHPVPCKTWITNQWRIATGLRVDLRQECPAFRQAEWIDSGSRR
jgi:hypothetical protein